jgi:hypothetical protein
MKLSPGVNPTKLFSLEKEYFSVFAIKLGHFIVEAIFFICYKERKLSSKNQKTKKNEVW